MGEPQLINLYSYVTLTTPVVWSVGTTGRVVGRFEHMLDRYTNWIRDSSLLTAMAVGEGLLGSGGGRRGVILEVNQCWAWSRPRWWVTACCMPTAMPHQGGGMTNA